MKVLLLTHSFPRFRGDPAGNFIFQLTQSLQYLGVEFHVVAPASSGYPDYEVMDGIHVYRFRYAPRKYETLAYTGNMAQDVSTQWSARFAMVGLLGSYFTETVRLRRKIQPDLIHAHWWFPGGLVGSWVSKMSHVPLISTLHGSDVRLIQNVSAAQSVARMVLEHSTKVTTVSRWLASKVVSYAKKADVVVAPMPVDSDLFSPDESTPRAENRFLFVGRINEQKGLGIAIRALAAMKQFAYLDVVGKGDIAEYEQLATELGVRDKVVFHGGRSHEQLPELYRSATALLVPSIDEGLGLVAVEAQLCETPVIAMESGGLTDIVQHDKTGLLIPVASGAPTFAAAMDELLSNKNRARSLGVAGRISALAGFAPESVALKYLQIYQDAVKSSAR